MFYTTPHTKPEDFILSSSPEEVDYGKKRSNRILLASVVILMVFGVIAIYSSSAYFAEVNSGVTNFYLIQHLKKLGIALFAMVLASKIDYHKIARFSLLGLVLCWGLLIFVQFSGTEIYGARRSLDLGFGTFQPSALAIFGLLLHLSVLIHKKQAYIKDFKKSFIPQFILVLITCGLIGMQDVSTALILCSMSLTIMFIGRVSFKYLTLLFLAGGLMGSLFVLNSPERKSRIVEYTKQVSQIKSDQLMQGEQYQAQQAQIAIARGQLFGVGIGKSTQRIFLPASYNDFIFAIITEEYGLVGSAFILLIFTVILIQGIYIARKAKDILGTILAASFTLAIAIYGFVNAAVATGLLPVTGLPMPFISYGGSSLIVSAFMVGVLLNISKRYRIPAQKNYANV